MTSLIGELYTNETIARRIRSFLRESHSSQDRALRNELKRLQDAWTWKNNKLSNLVDMLSDGSLPLISFSESRNLPGIILKKFERN